MARERSQLRVYNEARQIAIDHGLLVVHKGEKFLLYRNEERRQILLGARTTPSGIRSFVCKTANFQ